MRPSETKLLAKRRIRDIGLLLIIGGILMLLVMLIFHFDYLKWSKFSEGPPSNDISQFRKRDTTGLFTNVIDELQETDTKYYQKNQKSAKEGRLFFFVLGIVSLISGLWIVRYSRKELEKLVAKNQMST